MLKKSITYTDFDGNEVTDTFYFNLTKSEVVELEASQQGGIEAFVKRVSAAQDNKTLLAEFKRIVLLAYGEKSPDGKRFIKNDELREEFSQTAAFDELFIDLISVEGSAVNFFKGLLPKDLTEAAEQNKVLPPPNIQPVETLAKEV